MNGEPTRASSGGGERQREAIADALAGNGDVTVRITEDNARGRKCGYSLLIQGEIQASSILSSSDPGESVTLLEDDTKLVSGSVRRETAGFVLDGTIVAAEFDEPEPTVEVGGAIVDPRRWPTVKEYTGYGPGQEPVEDPFPNSGQLGKPPGDPLDPKEYVVTLEADGEDGADAYCIDLEGAVGSHPDDATVSDCGDRVFGSLGPDETAEIEVRGLITRIDTAEGITHSVRARE
jgi:hypothetical protein